jgi:hypothetical protein
MNFIQFTLLQENAERMAEEVARLSQKNEQLKKALEAEKLKQVPVDNH